MIKHVIFTDHALAKTFCYDLAATLTLAQRRAGTLAYAAAMPHPTTPNTFAVMVDDTDVDVMALVTAGAYTAVVLDTTWYSPINLPITPTQ